MVPPRKMPACTWSRPMPTAKHRIEDHRQGRERGDRRPRPGWCRARCPRVRGSTEAMASAAEAPQMPTAPPESTPKERLEAERPAPPARRSPMVVATPTTTVAIGISAQAQDLAGGDPRAQQRHAEPQHRLRGELDAGDAAALLVQEVEGHAEQQREQHHRRAVVLGEPGGGERDGRGDQKARPDRSSDRVQAGGRAGCRAPASGAALAGPPSHPATGRGRAPTASSVRTSLAMRGA